MGQKTAQMRGHRGQDRGKYKGCFWKDRGAQRSHENPTTPTPAGVCTWVTVLWRQHMSAGQNSKVTKTEIKGRSQIRSTVRIPTTNKDFTKLHSKRGKKTQLEDHQSQEAKAEDSLDSSQSCGREGRRAVCVSMGSMVQWWTLCRVCLGSVWLLWHSLTTTQQPQREQLCTAAHSETQGWRHTMRCPCDSGPALSPVPLQHPQDTAKQGHAGQSCITLYYLSPDAANNHILYWWLCCKWQSKASRDMLGLISLNSTQNDKARQENDLCLCQVQQQPKGKALLCRPFQNCNVCNVRERLAHHRWRRIISQPAGFHKENLKLVTDTW